MAAHTPSGNLHPSTDPGFAALPVGELLAANGDLIDRIRLCFGIDREAFERDVLMLLHRYAACVHLLPATADNYFSAPGGLLRLGLEVAFFSLQGTDAHIFAGRSTISARRQIEPRWRHATFIAGLCCELHRVVSHFIVTDSAGNEWPAYLEPLTDWLQARGAQRYYVRWRPNAVETRSLGIFALPHVVPPSVLQHLNVDNTIIVPHLLASIGGMPPYRDHNVLDGLVRRSLALVVDRNLQANADRYGAPRFGSHLERYLVDALRRLAAGNSAWMPNREKARVWYGSDGLFLVWPQSAGDVQALLEADQLPGIPKAPETMLEVLLAAGVFEAQEAGGTTWTIQPPEAKAPVAAVKLSSPTMLFAGVDPMPSQLDVRLLRRPGGALPAASKVPPTPTASSGAQLSLIEPPSADETASTPVHDPPAPSAAVAVAVPQAPEPPPPPAFALKAPLRLNPAVRDALAAVVGTLNVSTSPVAACTVANGLFIPLRELERRGIQPTLALRALADVRMLVHDDRAGPPTITRDFGGDKVTGLVIDPRFIDGFDLTGFALTEPAQD